MLHWTAVAHTHNQPALSLPSLAARAQLGDKRALNELLSRLEVPLLQHIRSIVNDDDVAADALQETLWIICRRLHSVREVNWVRAWSYRVANREALRLLRRERRSHTEPIESWDEIANPDSDAELDEHVLRQLSRRLDELPPACQTVLRMRYLHELSQLEIAEALEIPVGTVKSRIHYGLMLLRRALDDTKTR